MTPAKAKPASEPAPDASASPSFPGLTRADGPWSLENAPAGEAFISFGPLNVPAFASLQARLEIDPKTRQAGAVSILVDDSSVQIQVLGAPRGAPIWSDIRHLIARRVQTQASTSVAVEGEFGTELIVTRPIRTADGLIGAIAMRYVGIDGDRWMIRAVVSGPSALTDATVAKVNALLSHCAVDRGTAGFAPGRVMVLAMPKGAVVDVVTGQPDDGA